MVTSHRADGVRVITLHDRFVIHNSSKTPIYTSVIVSPVSSDRVALEHVYQHPKLVKQGQSQHLDALQLTGNHLPPGEGMAAALLIAFSLRPDGDHGESAFRYIGINRSGLLVLVTGMQRILGTLIVYSLFTIFFHLLFLVKVFSLFQIGATRCRFL